jgi:acetyltransferase-like isoleucine patch superfamily enzyme
MEARAHERRRINPPADSHLADHVWLGANATVLKGARIGQACIVGLGSMVSGTIPPNCLVAGTPARVVREAITWRRDLIDWAADAGPSCARSIAPCLEPS